MFLTIDLQDLTWYTPIKSFTLEFSCHHEHNNCTKEIENVTLIIRFLFLLRKIFSEQIIIFSIFIEAKTMFPRKFYFSL